MEALICEPDVFLRGESVALLNLTDAKKDFGTMEKYVKAIALLSGQRCDWHYTSHGTPLKAVICLKTMGDKSRVRQAMSTLARPAQIEVLEILE